MKKMWVKKDNIYYKPFYKQKFKLTLIGVFLMSIVFFSYQFFYISQLSASNSKKLIETEKQSLAVNSINNAIVDNVEKTENNERQLIR